MISVIDDSYRAGFCGLRTNRTEARFGDVDITFARPRCFVIMPFAPELDFVYQVIKETVEQHGAKCERGDERLVSEPIDVKDHIASADLVIIDFTDRNPNFYFEAGMAVGLRKTLISSVGE
jgi:hypothetical protein